MLNYAKMQEKLSVDSDLFQLHYSDWSRCLDMHTSEFGERHHMQVVCAMGATS